MATTSVEDVVLDAADQPVPRAHVIIELLVGATPGGVGFIDTGTIAGVAEIEAGDDGAWTADLIPNSEITPAGSVYRISYTAGRNARATIAVPAAGGPYKLKDILDVVPGALASMAARNVTVDEIAGLDARDAQAAIEELLANAGSGDGTVISVNDIDPDGGGNITLGPTDVGADAAGAASTAQSNAQGYADTKDAQHVAATDPHGDRAYADGHFIPTTQKGAANGVAQLDSGGKVPQGQLPSITISDWLGTAASQAAMLALTGQRGDWCTRTDLGTDFILIGDDASQLANWRSISTPSSPVSSVAGRTGAVTLSNTDVSGLGTAAVVDVPGSGDASSSQAVKGNDSRLTNARTATSHGSSHAAGGSDPLQVAAANRILGRITAGAGNAEELTAAQVKTILAIASGDVSGLGALATRAGLIVPTAVKTGNYTAVAGDGVPCDTTSAGFTVTLPNAPADGALVWIKHVTQGSTNVVTYQCAGSDVFNKAGGGTSGTLPLLAQAALLQYKASSGIWYVLADDLPLSQLLIAAVTFTNKRITKRVVTLTDATSITPNGDTSDEATLSSTQAAGTLTVNAPSGTPTDGQPLILRLKSTNAQTYAWDAIYRFKTTPVTLAAATTDYIGCLYDSAAAKWDVVAVVQGYA